MQMIGVDVWTLLIVVGAVIAIWLLTRLPQLDRDFN